MAARSSSSNGGSGNWKSHELTEIENKIEREDLVHVGNPEAADESGGKGVRVGRVYCELTAGIGPE